MVQVPFIKGNGYFMYKKKQLGSGVMFMKSSKNFWGKTMYIHLRNLVVCFCRPWCKTFWDYGALFAHQVSYYVFRHHNIVLRACLHHEDSQTSMPWSDFLGEAIRCSQSCEYPHFCWHMRIFPDLDCSDMGFRVLGRKTRIRVDNFFRGNQEHDS